VVSGQWSPLRSQRFSFLGIPLLKLSLSAIFACAISSGLAQIGTPVGIGNAGSTSSSTTLPIAVTSAVAANNTVIVTIVLWSYTGTMTVTDSGGNSYANDADITYSATGERTLVFSGRVVTPLTTSSSITVGFGGTSVQYKNASAFSVSGLVLPSAKDQAATAVGTSLNPSAGPAPTTAQANELLVGAFGVDDGGGTAAFTAGANYAALPSNVTSAGLGIFPEYQIVSATGGYSANETLSGTVTSWAAAIVTYKALTATTTTVATSGTPATYGSTVTFTATVTPGAAAGTVNFYDGGTLLGSGTLSGSSPDTATYTTTATQLAAGTHSSITAVYQGNGTYASSTSPAIAQTVSPLAVQLSGTRVYDGTIQAPAGYFQS